MTLTPLTYEQQRALMEGTAERPSFTAPDGREGCAYCAERLAVNVGLLADNAKLRKVVDGGLGGEVNTPPSNVSVEGTCDACGSEYTTPWYAPNDLWNEVNGSPNGCLCPNCFVAEGNIRLGPQIWKLTVDA